MKYLYVLELEGEHYYVGRTDKLPEERFKEHIQGRGSWWTKKHKPLYLTNVKEGDYDGFDEDSLTKKLMNKYGIEKVRGGSYSNFEFTKEQMKILKREINHNNDVCIKCGSKDHWVKDCKKVNNKKDDLVFTKEELDQLLNYGKNLVNSATKYFKSWF